MSRAPRRRTFAVLTLTGLAALAGCSNPYSGDLLLADVPSAESATGDIGIWAVDPGEETGDDNLVTSSALSPLEISTRTESGLNQVNSLGRTWNSGVVTAYSNAEGSIVTAGSPGGDQERIASSVSARTTMLRRGAYVQTAEGCVLATSTTTIEELAEGTCVISQDERWVASWPQSGEGLTIKDLRDDSVERVPDLVVTNAAALGRDARVLVVARTAEGFEGVVVDGTNGEVVGRTDTYAYLEVATVGAEAEGFVLQAADTQGSTQLLHVDTDAQVQRIDEGFYLVPVANGHEVTYLKYGEDLSTSSLRRWSADDAESHELLGGYVGAGTTDGEHVVATRETAEGTEFWREEGGTGELTRALTLPRAEDDADPSTGGAGTTGVGVSQMFVLDSTAHLQVQGTSTSSYVRIDLSGDDSDVPLEHEQGLLLESLDVDGTALLTRTGGDETDVRTDVLVVRPHHHDPDLRTTVGRTATNLIHEGRIYLTDSTDPAAVTVGELRAIGKDDDVDVLYTGKQVAGATWPQHGGAVTSVLITPRLLLEQAAQQQQAAQEQAAAQQQVAQPQG